ncbi:MAG: Flp family type IVb pilin [Candidatus Omnitrophica bacterium]|nr:Flp family type IVb pilin [Candidatus Omnitrophota bacterium]
MRQKRNKKNHTGQSIIEYVLVATIIAAAVMAMSTYVFRSVQSTQQMIQKESSKE